MIKILINETSQVGLRHKNTGEENQDVIMSVENKRYTVISLADGVSTCKKAREGAIIACEAITKLFSKKGDFFIECDRERMPKIVLKHILYELNMIAVDAGIDIKEYSSTLASVLIDKQLKKLLVFNLGDSMILETKNTFCSILSMPADSTNGCPVTTTKNAELVACCEVMDLQDISSVTICSDGAWKNLFKRNCMCDDVKEMFLNHEFNELESMLKKQNISDDYSIITVKIQEEKGRAVA